jgi:site-specific DNA-adenine methylase
LRGHGTGSSGYFMAFNVACFIDFSPEEVKIPGDIFKWQINEPPRSKASRNQRNVEHDYSPSPCPLAQVARDEFERFKTEEPQSLTDIQRAVKFYYLLRNGYGGKIYKPSFNIAPTKRSSFNLLRIEEELSAAHLRLCRVYIENKPYEEIIKRYDRPGIFFI